MKFSEGYLKVIFGGGGGGGGRSRQPLIVKKMSKG